jgi:hypothetical protein
MPDKAQETKPTSSDGRAREPWEPFRLEERGNLAEVIKGGGKTGAAADGDPQSSRKGGVG